MPRHAPFTPAEEQQMQTLEILGQTVHGWNSRAERLFLYRAARAVSPPNVIVEIGSWKGKSTMWLAHGARAGGGAAVHAIDPFTGSSEHYRTRERVWTFDEFKETLARAGATESVVPHVSKAEDAAPGWNLPIGFLFIDGAHEYEAVKKDFDLWSPHVAEGGVIAFHDTTPALSAILRGIPLHGLPGPRRVIEESIFPSKNFTNVGVVGSIVYATRTAAAPAVASWVSRRLAHASMITRYAAYWFYPRLTTWPTPVKAFVKRLFIH